MLKIYVELLNCVYHLWAHVLFAVIAAMDWEKLYHLCHASNSLICIYVLMINNPISIYTDIDVNIDLMWTQ